jgi:antitoxin (DNA-binding transcriptional repressor) of toxin-antitoxin stability system
MSRELTLEELRERPGELIDAIEKGEAITITRDGSSVAEVHPLEPIEIVRHDPSHRLRDFRPGKAQPHTGSVDWLINERERGRSGER